MNDSMLDDEQEAIEHKTHDADRQNADEDIVRSQEAAGIENDPTEPGTAGEDRGGEGRRIDDADGEARAGEDLMQGRGKDDEAEHLPLGRTERARRLDALSRDARDPVHRGDRGDRKGGQKEQND